MNEKLLLLRAGLGKDEIEIARHYAEIKRHEQSSLAEEDKAIVLGYYLHNLYLAFENAFKQIARVFENDIRSPSEWHAELLQRMTLDVPGLRPRFVGEEAVGPLDELRRFRHMFRTAYTSRLDMKRMALALERAHELESLYPKDFARFREFLDQALDRERP